MSNLVFQYAILSAATLVFACSSGDQRADAPRSATRTDSGSASASDPGVRVKVENPRYIAVVTSPQDIDIRPESTGKIVAFHVAVGQPVRAEQLIATIDDQSIRDALSIARTELESARATQRQARADMMEARNQLRVERKLEADGVSSRAELDSAEFAYQRARAAHARAKAAVGKRELQVEQIERLVGETEIRAPFDGIIAARYRDVGARIARAEKLVRLIDRNNLRVRFAVPVDQADSIRVGHNLRVEIGERSIAAVVQEIAPQIDEASQMIFATASFKDESGQREAQLQPGVAAWVYAQNNVPE